MAVGGTRVPSSDSTPSKSTTHAPASGRAPLNARQAQLLSLQGSAGNRAVQRMLNGAASPVQRIPSEDEPVGDALSAYGSNYGNYAGGGAEPAAVSPVGDVPGDALAASAYNYIGAASEPPAQAAPERFCQNSGLIADRFTVSASRPLRRAHVLD